MASYEIKWKHSAEQELKNIDRQYIPRILEAVESLTDKRYRYVKIKQLEEVDL